MSNIDWTRATRYFLLQDFIAQIIRNETRQDSQGR